MFLLSSTSSSISTSFTLGFFLQLNLWPELNCSRHQMHFPSFHNFFCSSDRLDGIRMAPKSNFLRVGRKADGGGALSRPGVCQQGVGFDRISQSSNVSRLAAVSMAASRLATFMAQRSLAVSGLRVQRYALNWTGAGSADLIWLSFSWKI
jgi:hypothetical protein